MNLEKFKTLLNDQLEKTEEEVERLKRLCQPIPPDDAIGRLSRMEAINEKSVNEAALNKAKLRITQLNSAISRMKKDEYGICLRCEEEISEKRLMAVPESTLCIDCLNNPEDD